MLRKSPVELARQVVARPDRVTVHADRRCTTCGPHPCTPEAAMQHVMPDFPGTDTADHRTHELAARPQQPRTLGRRCTEVRHAVQRPQVRIDAVEFAFYLVELVY